MPQLDRVSFFTQFFWFLVAFLGFYLLCVQVFLPKLARIQKTRAWKLAASESTGTQLDASEINRHHEQWVQERLLTFLLASWAAQQEGQAWAKQQHKQSTQHESWPVHQAILQEWTQTSMMTQAQEVFGSQRWSPQVAAPLFQRKLVQVLTRKPSSTAKTSKAKK